MVKFLKSLFLCFLVLAVSSGIALAVTIWNATDRSPAVGTERIPVDTSGSSSPGYLEVGDIRDFVDSNSTLLVTGPAGATDNAVVRYDATTGRLIQNSTLIATDTDFLGIAITPTTALHVDSNAADTTAIATIENTNGNFAVYYSIATPEGAITGSRGDIVICDNGSIGVMFIKAIGDGTNTGWRRMIPDVPMFRSRTMTTQGIGTGIFYTDGHYEFSTSDANLTQASTTQTFGAINEASATHASLIAGGAGSASGGAGAVEIEISGTSITEAGVRTTSDTEILVADITAMSTDEYFETTKKWLGQITYTLQNAGGSTQTTFNADFNYGHTKYTDMGDRDFTITDFKIDGLAGANDTGFDVRLLKHSSSGWTYAATGFSPGNGPIASLATDYVTEKNLVNGSDFAYDRTNLNTAVEGSGSEGYIVEITTGANNAIQYINTSVGVLFD